MIGLRMASFYGNFFNRSSDLCAFPAFPRDQGYVVEVAIDENLTKPVACVQAAILHSTCYGTTFQLPFLMHRREENPGSYDGDSNDYKRRRCLCFGRSNCNRNLSFFKSL